MSGLRDILERHVSSGSLPGAVGLVARGDRVEVEAVGSADLEGTAPMVRDSIFRIASMTKPLTAAATMTLVEERLLALGDEIAPWLPELAAPLVARTPASALDDLVPADRPITVFDLLTSRAGYGFPSDFSLPALAPLVGELKQGPARPQDIAAPDVWLKTLAGIPLLHQPGEAFLYNTCSDILGVLIARVSGQSLPEFMAERIFEPLGMSDTGFCVPASDLGRFTSFYREGEDGLALADAPHDQWSSLPAFPSGAGGLVSTADDWWAFGRMLLAQGELDGGRGRLLSADSVRRMTTDWLTPAQRSAGELFLEGQGWGFGGSVDITARDPWNVPGRYGWIGGSGTAGHVTPATGTVSIVLTQREMNSPTPPAVMRDFWTYAAGA
ncbi:serine hydrolase domain-containing protein [Streptomyces sp. NPDC001903]|uniref:serine hydrolase domain-containing protein n=1 Tax=Streptomyces sp. NPDC001903 TaxID=3364622 RepID=UPI003697AB46